MREMVKTAITRQDLLRSLFILGRVPLMKTLFSSFTTSTTFKTVE